MRLPSLTRKEFRDLLDSRAYWLLLLFMGPLVGHQFITAVETYAEMSAPGALAQGLSPLDGIFVPAFGAYDLAVTLLFPFVAIRLVSADRSTGAWKLMLQSPPGMGSMLGAKAMVLLAGWTIAWIPGLLCVALWKAYGGALWAPELANLLAGHMVRLLLSAGVAVAAAAAANSAAGAAIATLGFTVGTWALDFVAAGRGGLLQQLAAYTPAAALRVFEHGEFRLRTVLVAAAFTMASFVFAAVWLAGGRTFRRRLLASVLLLPATAAALWAASLPRAARDVSENRRNSFSRAEEAALRRIRQPLHITVMLAAEDPRLTDLDRNILDKLRRILPRVDVDYAAGSRTGLFEGADEHYGEIWYRMGEKRVMSRSTTEPIVLDLLFSLANVAPPVADGEASYSGHPLRAQPRGAAILYYFFWPVVVVAAAWLYFRK